MPSRPGGRPLTQQRLGRRRLQVVSEKLTTPLSSLLKKWKELIGSLAAPPFEKKLGSNQGVVWTEGYVSNLT